MRFLVTMLLCLLPLCAQDPPPAQKKGGGARAPAKNLKVLTQDELNSGVMGTYVAALGVGPQGGCNFCHVQDRSSDENPKKVTARMMITMVKDINSKFPPEADKVFVTCYTCHRGKTEPDIKAPPPAGQPQP
jgi:photosynthetic reaction center cytochrome c subunit